MQNSGAVVLTAERAFFVVAVFERIFLGKKCNFFINFDGRLLLSASAYFLVMDP